MSRVARAFASAVVFLCLPVVEAAARAAPETPETLPATAPRGAPAALTPAECLAALNELNEANKLVPDAVFPGVRLNGLTEDGCHGVRWESGERVVAIDLGSSGFEGSITEQSDDGSFGAPLSFRMMGFLASELPISVGKLTLPAGAYAVEAFTASLRLVGNHETATRYDPAQRKELPLPKTFLLELNPPLSGSRTGTEATEMPHFALALTGGTAVLQSQNREWKVEPHM